MKEYNPARTIPACPGGLDSTGKYTFWGIEISTKRVGHFWKSFLDEKKQQDSPQKKGPPFLLVSMAGSFIRVLHGLGRSLKSWHNSFRYRSLFFK